jgi:hypothetical protein
LNLTLPDAFLPDAKRKGKREKKAAKSGTGAKGKGKGKGGAADPWRDVVGTS